MRSFLQLCEVMKRCDFLLLLFLAFSLQPGDCIHRTQVVQELTAGHVSFLTCDHFLKSPEYQAVKVNWTRELNQDWDAGIKVINQSLWFFPVQESHSGNYSCNFSDEEKPFENHFSIAVSGSKCPPAGQGDQVPLTKGRIGLLFCNSEVMEKIVNLKSVSVMGWTWMKDCSPLDWHETSERNLQFSSVSESDEGFYTCILNFTLNGTSYTVAHSKQVWIREPSPVPQKPGVIQPRQETLAVKLNSKQVLNCKVFVGYGSCEDIAIDMIKPYWLVDGEYSEKYQQQRQKEQFLTHHGCTVENGAVYQHSNLTILEVQREFLNIPFQCRVLTSYGSDNGTVILTELKELHCVWAVLTAHALVALGFLLVYLFKVDLVLAYRKLSPCLKQQDDGKLYDAYVSYPHGDDHSVSSALTFALHILPAVLEDQLGYKLFIRGRDALPGEAVHDVISETIGKSRRLIIVLPSQASPKSSDNQVGLLNKIPPEQLSLNNNITTTGPGLSESSLLNWDECWVGLYDALVKECLQVILVQVGGAVDDALLPESLRYVRRAQGMLKWKQHYTSKPNGRFWKQMRYRMPPVQKSKTAVMV